jgi:hypothetical protein
MRECDEGKPWAGSDEPTDKEVVTLGVIVAILLMAAFLWFALT